MRRYALLTAAIAALLLPGCKSLLYGMMGAVSGDPSHTAMERQAEFMNAADAHENYEKHGAWPGRDY